MKNIAILCIIFFILGAVSGYSVFYFKGIGDFDSQAMDLRPIRFNNLSYKFVNPLLAYVIPSAEQDPKWADLKRKISETINSVPKEKLEKVSVFVSGLNQGRWIGINENELYPPASMSKVIIMMIYLRGEQENPGLLDKKMTYTSKDIAVTLNNLTSLKVGQSYTISDLIDKMIIDSDNGAEALLFFNADQKFFSGLFSALGIKGFEDGIFYISPRQYSLFFRIIYNATFLDADLSEKALNILSQTKYNDGIVAGVPSNIVVAHKFGQYTNPKNNHDIELHDCGIIYLPQNPYFLCIMTKGEDLEVSSLIIKTISELVYKNLK